MFRNGYFETVEVLKHGTGQDQRAYLDSIRYEPNFIKLLQNIRAEYQYLGIGIEMTAMMSIIGADRVELGFEGSYRGLSSRQGYFDRDVLVLPDILLPAELSEDKALRPVFDLIWQSAGMERCSNYNEQGEWREAS